MKIISDGKSLIINRGKAIECLRFDEQIEEKRNRVGVTEMLNKMLGRANRMLQGKRIHFGEMVNTALNYLINGWEILFNYRHDGHYDNYNMEVERKI